MLLYITFGITAAIFVFALLNTFWFKVKLSPWVLKILKKTHLILLCLFALLVLSELCDLNYHLRGRYTTFIIFWALFITGFGLFAFEFQKLYTRLLRVYLYCFHFIWILILIPILINKGFVLYVLFVVSSLNVFSSLPGRVEFNNTDFRLEVNNVHGFMAPAPQYYNSYLLIEKKGLLERNNVFSFEVYCDSKFEILNADVKRTNGDSAIVIVQLKNDNCKLHYDSATKIKTITQKVKLN